MPTQHALKREARALMARFPSQPLTYTKARALVVERHNFDLRAHTVHYDGEVLREAASHLLSGNDIIIFGQTAAGKTTVMHSIMELLSGTPRHLIMPDNGEAGLKTADKSYRIEQGITLNESPTLSLGASQIVAVDELRAPIASAFEALLVGKAFMTSIHAQDTVMARYRLDRLVRREWRRPLLLKVAISGLTGVRSVQVVGE